MSREMGGPSPEEMGIQPEKKQERKMFEITDNPDGTFTARLPAATIEGEPDLIVPQDKTFGTRGEAEEAVAKAKENLEKN